MPFKKTAVLEEKNIPKVSPIESIQNRILKTLVKPADFDRLEIKEISDGLYRINVVTKVYKEGGLFPIYGRPMSWVERLSGEDK